MAEGVDAGAILSNCFNFLSRVARFLYSSDRCPLSVAVLVISNYGFALSAYRMHKSVASLAWPIHEGQRIQYGSMAL